jgi:hypothetical protein
MIHRMIGGLIARMSDRIVIMLAPRVTASASDCQEVRRCERDWWGSLLYRQTCCSANGRLSCGPWIQACFQCC